MRPGIPPLAGYRVAVTADRRAEEQIALLERRGASVLNAPCIRTVPIIDSDQLGTAIDQLIDQPPDVVVLLTGIGTRAMFAAAEGLGIGDELAAALAGAVVLARGPKAAGAGTTVGLDIAWQAPSERSSEILDRLREEAAAGARIAVQRDGQCTPDLASALCVLGARTVDVPVYRWELPEDTRPAARLVEQVIDRDVDVVTFTSSPALRHLAAVADASGRGDELVAALQGDVAAACVGPVCAETAAELGITSAIVPRRSRLGAMVQAIVTSFDGRSRTIQTRAGALEIQGRSVFVDGRATTVGPRERAVLTTLADADGAVVPKARLLRAVWGPDFADDHAVEVAIGRLRRSLGAAGAAVKTVARRGYRLAG